MKPDDGVWIDTRSNTEVEIEGRMKGRGPIRAIVMHGHPVVAEVITVEMLNLDGLKRLHQLLAGVIEAIEIAQREMVKVNDSSEN